MQATSCPEPVTCVLPVTLAQGSAWLDDQLARTDFCCRGPLKYGLVMAFRYAQHTDVSLCCVRQSLPGPVGLAYIQAFTMTGLTVVRSLSHTGHAADTPLQDAAYLKAVVKVASAKLSHCTAKSMS